MTAVFTRILLRWLAGALVTYGVLTADLTDIFASDPDLVALVEMGINVALGLVAGALAEGWYYLAKRFGWTT